MLLKIIEKQLPFIVLSHLCTPSKWNLSFRFSDLFVADSSWNVMAHGDAWEGKWRGNWRMEWIASTLHTTSEHSVSSITTADAHTSAASSRLNWCPPADLNGLVRFAERRNLVSACVPSHFKCSLPHFSSLCHTACPYHQFSKDHQHKMWQLLILHFPSYPPYHEVSYS